MSDQTFNTNDQIVITVKKSEKGKEIGRPVKRRRLVQKSKRTSDILSRRKRGGAITFYDMGQIMSGASWITKDVSISPGLSAQPAPDGDDLGLLISDLLTDTQYNAIVDDLIGVGQDNLLTTYRKVPLAASTAFRIDVIGETDAAAPFSHSMIDGGDSAWNAAGLTLTQPELDGKFTVSVISLADSFGTKLSREIYVDPTISKITATYNYSDTTVAFQPKNGDVYFLLPKVCRHQGSASVPINVGGGYFRYDYFNFIFRFKERYFSEPAAITETGFGDDAQAITKSLAISPSRVPAVLQNHNVPYDNSVTTGSSAALTYLTFADQGLDVGYLKLQGVVKQGANFFYFWDL